MIQVIKDFGLSSLGLTKEDFRRKNFVTQLGYEPLRIDILNDMDGVPFSTAWENKREVMFEGNVINFIGYNELLELKKNAGRSQDLTDIKKLTERNKNK